MAFMTSALNLKQRPFCLIIHNCQQSPEYGCGRTQKSYCDKIAIICNSNFSGAITVQNLYFQLKLCMHF